MPRELTSTYQCMYRDHCYYASDYSAEIRAMGDATTMAKLDRVIQYPWIPTVSCLDRSTVICRGVLSVETTH